MSSGPLEKPLFWIGSSLEDLRGFPEEVKDEVGFALYQAQTGLKPRSAKPLKGFGGASVLEIVDDFGDRTPTAPSTCCTPSRRNRSAAHGRPAPRLI
jgi:phage-related protein